MKKLENIPIILIVNSLEDIEQLSSLGKRMDDYIVKPYHKHEIVERARLILSLLEVNKRPKNIQVGDLVIEIENY